MERNKLRPSAIEMVVAIILAILMAFMDISGLPSALFMNVHFSDVEPFYFS